MLVSLGCRSLFAKTTDERVSDLYGDLKCLIKQVMTMSKHCLYGLFSPFTLDYENPYPSEKIFLFCLLKPKPLMKNQHLLSILFVFVCIIGYSQDKGYIAISAGPSFPNGDFGSKDVNNESAGLANTGAIFDLTFAQKFGKTFGMTLMLRGQVNGVDSEPLVDELYNQSPEVTWSAETDTWGIGGFMAGLYGSFPMGSNGKVTFDTRAMIGFIDATSPQITIYGDYLGTTFWVNTESASAGAFAYLFGAGFRFNLGNHFCILTNLDYLGSTPEFEGVVTRTSLGGYSTNTYQQSFGTVNVGVGIGYRW